MSSTKGGYSKFRRFAIRIPPSKTDSEIRLLVERHLVEKIDPNETFTLSLYDFDPWQMKI